MNWIGAVIIALLIVGILLREKIVGLFKKKKKEVPPTDKPLPKPEEPKNNKPEPEPEPKPEPKVYRIEIPDTDEDLTQYINAELAKIPDGTKELPSIIEFPDKRIWTEGNEHDGIINLTNRHNLIIRGGTFYTKAPAVPYGGNIQTGNYSDRRHFWLRFCTNITLEKIRVEGSNTISGKLLGTAPEYTPDFWYIEKNGQRLPAPFDNGSISGAPGYKGYWEFEHAFSIEHSHNIVCKDLECNGVWGDGIYVGGKDQTPSTDVQIIGGHFRFTGRQGIALCNARRVLIENVFVDQGRRASIDLEPYEDEGFVTDVIIRNNNLRATMTVIAALGRGDVSDIYIHDNEYRTQGSFIDCRDEFPRKNWKVCKNKRIGDFGSPRSPIKFNNVSNIEIIDNVEWIDPKQSQKAATFSGCKNVVVSGNDFGAGKYIETYDCENVNISQPEIEIIT